MYVLNPRLRKVMDFLLDNAPLDFSKTEIAEYSKIGRATLNRMWEQIENLGLVIPTRKYGGTQLFKLNIKSELVNKIAEIMDRIEQSEEKSEEETKQKEIEIDM